MKRFFLEINYFFTIKLKIETFTSFGLEYQQSFSLKETLFKDKNKCHNRNKHNLLFLDAFRFNFKYPQ